MLFHVCVLTFVCYFYSQLSCKITVIWSVLRVHIVPIRERAAGVTVLVKLNVAYLAILW